MTLILKIEDYVTEKYEIALDRLKSQILTKATQKIRNKFRFRIILNVLNGKKKWSLNAADRKLFCISRCNNLALFFE